MRYLCYNGNLYWTEYGYRFSWRVMLMEKSGSATFYIKEKNSTKEWVVNNSDFLNQTQEKQMSFQPDMIIEFGHFLAKYYQNSGTIIDPSIRVEAYVTLNGRKSQLLFNPQKNILMERESFSEFKFLNNIEK